MKFSTQEEYGLRCLLRIGKADSKGGITIPEISQVEGLSTANVAKLLRILRMGGFIESERGQAGGYRLARPAAEIIVGEVLTVLGGRLFDKSFCFDHAGIDDICTHTIDCSVRSLWKTVQNVVDKVLDKTSLKDLLGSEMDTNVHVSSLAENINGFSSNG